MNDEAICVNQLEVYYRHLNSFRLTDLLCGKAGGRQEVCHALRGVSFAVRRGEIVGIVGKNGSGKSTLLRAVAGIFRPDGGSIALPGGRAALMALGGGFLPEATGYENIMLSGLLMGFTHAAVLQKLPEIAEFSGLNNFLNAPVYSYSSGMVSKLAFAVLVTLRSDILLVDEIFSVGDAEFRKKSYARMQNLMHEEERTVLLVSHEESVLRENCTRLLWLDEGRLLCDGPVGQVLTEYAESRQNR